MKLELTHDALIDAWTVRCENVHIETKEHVAQWEQLMSSMLEGAPNERFDMMIRVEGFSLSPSQAAAYGKVVKALLTTRVRSIVRYGSDKGMTTTAVRLGAVLSRFPANIFPDRAHAVEALRRIRRHAA